MVHIPSTLKRVGGPRRYTRHAKTSREGLRGPLRPYLARTRIRRAGLQWSSPPCERKGRAFERRAQA